VREEYGVNPCDKRKPATQLKEAFPWVDFSLMDSYSSDEDSLWHPSERESYASAAARGKQFLEWLKGRPERVVAVVSHSGFMRILFEAHMGESHYFPHGSMTTIMWNPNSLGPSPSQQPLQQSPQHTQHIAN